MTLQGEILPKETIDRLRAFLEARKTGQFTLHIKDGKVLKSQVTAWYEEALDKEEH